MKFIIKILYNIFVVSVVFFSLNKKSFSVPINTFIDNVNPSMNAVSVYRASNITVVFMQPMNASTVNNSNIKVFGYLTGLLSVVINYNSVSKILTIDPAQDMKIGEEISVTLTNGILTEGGQVITPFVYKFTVQTLGGNGIFIRSSGISLAYDAFLKSGDIDGDGNIDIVASNKIYKNDGHANFSFLTELSQTGSPELADFDNDGNLDILIQNGNTVYFYHNDGTGNFIQTYTFTGAVSNFGDLNGDGFLDIAFYNPANNLEMTLMKNNNGILIPDTSFIFTQGYLSSYRDRVIINDFNNDGGLDLIGIHGATFGYLFYELDKSFVMFTNDMHGKFSKNHFLDIEISNIRPDVEFYFDSKSFDFDDDGYNDVFSPGVILKNLGNSTFSHSSGPGFTNSSDFDFNGNGIIDVAGTDWYSPLLLHTNNGSGNFVFSLGSSNSYDNLTAGDFDNDGDIDIAAYDVDNHEISILLNSDSPLPVELSSFNSSVILNTVTLNWTTAMEENNLGFEVERSKVKGQTSDDWSKVGFVQGNGNSNTSHNYSYSDRNLQSGKYKYRLKQTDFNGNFKYHNLSGEVIIGVPEKSSLAQNYPNPFNPVTKLGFGISNLGFVSLKVYNTTGKEVVTLVNEKRDAGYYEASFDGNNLPSGMYFYRLSVDGKTVDTRRMALVK